MGTFEVPEPARGHCRRDQEREGRGVSDPLRTNDGYQIFRVDARTAASDASVFNENQVREAMTIERAPKAREDYLQNLRNEAYIKISENYHAGVAPLLKLKPEAIVETTGDAGVKVPEKKGKGKFLKIFPKPIVMSDKLLQFVVDYPWPTAFLTRDSDKLKFVGP